MKGVTRKKNEFTAENLPKSRLDAHIEERVNNFLQENNVNAGKVYIRMVSNSDETMTVQQQMHDLFVKSSELAATFPYRSKSMFAFQEINGVDVLIFAMFVQEYGSECPNPNARHVFFTFLDSVHFFEPRHYRSAMYHEILLGYMDFVKGLGYAMVNIWACPPASGEHYIFYSHPTEQKIPDVIRLRSWYEEILKKGKMEGIIDDYKNIMEQAQADKVSSAAELPYFYKDYWPYFLEEAITGMRKSEGRKTRKSVKICVAFCFEH